MSPRDIFTLKERKHASDKGLETLLMNTEGGHGASGQAIVNDEEKSCQGERFEGRRCSMNEKPDVKLH